jgi:hypothetical protein
MEYASKGVAGSGLGLGIAGTALGLLNGGLGGILGGIGGNAVCSESTMVNRYELGMTQQMANKDMEIAYWRGQDETNKKISDAFINLTGQINDLAKEVRCNKDEQGAINLQQAVYNGTNTAALNCMQGQIAQLFSLTKLVVPNASVCPGWGNVTITPATTTTG